MSATPQDLTQAPAHELLALYRSGQASPVEVTQAVLSRIERVNPQINALRLVDEKAAMAPVPAKRAGRRTDSKARPWALWTACPRPSRT